MEKVGKKKGYDWRDYDWKPTMQLKDGENESLYCYCGNKIDKNNYVMVITNSEPRYYCCGECYESQNKSPNKDIYICA